ncbi:hypothetical protein [Streptomyces sp. NPDC091217]|uniref:hypothetical protein n=1 Tax=Streptomyces sp. NPDC091217 TaxID=3365975 RepID=UPI0037FEE18F
MTRRGRAAAGGGQAADVADCGGLFPQSLDLLVLGREPGDGEGLERGELGQCLVAFREPFLELGDLGLEPFDLRGPGVERSARPPAEP